jgi:hypothetical protein
MILYNCSEGTKQQQTILNKLIKSRKRLIMTTLTMIKNNYIQGLKDFASVSIERKNYVSLYKQEVDDKILLSNGHIIFEIDKDIFNGIVPTLPVKYQRFYSDFKKIDLKKFMYDVEGDFAKGKVTSLVVNQINTFNTKTLQKRVCSMVNNEDGKQYTSYCYIDDVYVNIVRRFCTTNDMIYSKDGKCVIFNNKATNCRALIMCLATPSFKIKEEISQELGLEL